MYIFLGILLAIFVFLLIVLIHEFGHFITARLSGMKVEEFGFGIPPRVKKIFTDKHGTDFTWNLLPIGGFVRIYGEDPTGEDAFKKGAFMTKKWIYRSIVLLAGVTMNFFLASIIFSGLFFVGTKPLTVITSTPHETRSFFLPSFSEGVKSGFVSYTGISLTPLSGSIAEKNGVKKGDIVLSMNGQQNITLDTISENLKKNKEVSFIVSNSGATRNITLTPKDGKVGMMMRYEGLSLNKEFHKKLPLGESIVFGIKETYNGSVMTLVFLSDMLHGLIAPTTPEEREDAKNMLSGPIGVGHTFVALVENKAGLQVICIIIALLSINLGVINLLPFPALDGGRFITTTLYSFLGLFGKGKTLFLKIEKYFHAAGFILLLMLMLYVAGIDISRFF